MHSFEFEFQCFYTNHLLKDTQERESFLLMAVSEYIICLKEDGDFDAAVYRICSLWFANESTKPLQDMILDRLETIPTFKWLQIINQLASRYSQLALHVHFGSL